MKIVKTLDGSTTLWNEDIGDHYHSLYGAEAESKHVFIKMGLEACLKLNSEISILEVGFGTGLNACLTFDSVKHTPFSIKYTTLEPFPIEYELIAKLDFPVLKKPENNKIFHKMHSALWNEKIKISHPFSFIKHKTEFKQYLTHEQFDLIYYDAFGPQFQPELWDESSTKLIGKLLKPGGIIVTYCAQGQFRRNLENVRLIVERLEGPAGKREMIRATKEN